MGHSGKGEVVKDSPVQMESFTRLNLENSIIIYMHGFMLI